MLGPQALGRQRPAFTTASEALARGRRLAGGGGALLALAAALAAAATSQTRREERWEAEAPPVPPSPPPTAAQIVELRDWLSSRGCDVSLLDFAPSGGGAGTGVWLRSQPPRPWWAVWPSGTRGAPRVLASFPLGEALSAWRVTRDEALGGAAARWLAEEAVNERQLLQLFLLAQRAAGAASAYAPYLAALPSDPGTPLCWSEAELAQLAGTTAWEAARAQRRALAASWARLRPLAAEAAAAAGARGAPTLEDWRWAVATYWSRALAYPDPSLAAAAAAAGGPPPPLGEAIVPGLDFCNHARGAAAARWTLYGPAARLRPGEAPGAFLLCDGGEGRRLRCGAELCIDYGGGRPNEELLFNYGFCETGNGADALMVAPPLPRGPQEAAGDEALGRRLALLRARSKEPRVFLPSTARGRAGAKAAAAAVEDALAMLSVFAMTAEEAGAALAAAEGAAAEAAAESRRSRRAAREEAARLRRGALMLLLRLLQQRVAAMAATGSVAEDEAALLAGEGVPPRRRAAIIYRAQQKRLAAQYLALVRAMARREGVDV